MLEGELELTVDGVTQVAALAWHAIAEQRAALGPGVDRWAGHHRRLRRGQSSANPRVTPKGSGIRNPP